MPAHLSELVIMAASGWKTSAMFRRYAIASASDPRAAIEMLERAQAENISPPLAPYSTESTSSKAPRPKEQVQ
jgi:hypothetical protein